MGVAATTHNRNRLSSVPHYKLSQLARLYKRPPPITRVSLSSLAKCDDDDGGGGGGLSERKESTTPWRRLDDKNRTWTSKETSSRVTDRGIVVHEIQNFFGKGGPDDT